VADSALTGFAHLYGWWAIAAIVPAAGAIRAWKRSGAAWSRPVMALQIALSISIASLVLPLLVADGIGAWVVPLWIPGSIVVPASVLLLALGASSRYRDVNRTAVLLGCAVPAISILALILPEWGGSQATASTYQWLGENADLGGLVGWVSKLPLTYGLPCMLVSLAIFLDEYARPPKTNLHQAGLAGLACATPALTVIVCAFVGRRYGLEPVSLSFLVSSVVFGWILYPGRVAYLSARMAAIDALGEAVVIVDSANKIVDANSRGIDLLQSPSGDLRGCSADTEFAAIPELAALLADPSELCVEFFTGKTAGTRRCHEARVHTLEDGESEGSRVFAVLPGTLR